ncbi:hypothetical protein PRZ48_012272 [Zasmidium cellare]|uniref:DUF1742-domain-containing protein n=1 Tax=Zasmidium cellare TaxID=395010 RepID=A0ABR0E4D1_ZASCE|nr:hypothetical protein PRZ48_012272 [Zasmidium cellare]
MASKNLYYRRLVAESGAKACWVCYRPSSTVLISDDSADWFYVCPGHLNDTKFAIPKDAEDNAKKQHDAAIEKEIEAVKKEFEEKMRKKLDRRKQKEYEKDGGKGKEKEKEKEEKEDDKDEQDKVEKLKELEKKKEPEKAKVEGNRIFELHKNFFTMRIQKKRDAEQAKRTRDRLRNPTSFPSVPSGEP